MKVEDLAVIGLNSTEQLIGEIITSQTQGEEKTLIGNLKMRNPKRYVRIQQMTPQGLAIQYLIGDLDMLDAGVIQLISSFGYMVEDMTVEGQTTLVRLYLDFLQRKQVNKAQEAGLVLPQGIQTTRGALR